jgi:hypothetical protein|tara:strand:+ start:10647 stop:11507 length:861 start_codon:yes stop_codon:yes gene_type:complete
MTRNLILTEKQLTSLINEIGEVMVDGNIRGYSFDWDDNILFMPTKIKMEKKESLVWVPINVSTEDFAELRNDSDYRLTDHAFMDFEDPQTFISDVRKAIENEKFAPSFEKLKESLINANPFSIITARGTPSHAIKEGVRMVIGTTFTTNEVDTMVGNIESAYPSTIDMSLEEKIDFYLSENDYSAVSSNEFKEKFGMDSNADRPEEGKKIALRDYVKRVVNGAEKLTSGEYDRLTIGFSDDDRRNIDAVMEFIRDELSIEYPDVEFFIYDTSQGEKNKIIVSKVSE